MRIRLAPYAAAIIVLLTGVWLPGIGPDQLLGPATAATATPDATDPLQEFIDRTRSASGTFTQQVLREGHVIETSSGRFAFERPDRFDWEVREPFEQRLIADGQRLYFYDHDLAQVTIHPLHEALASTPAAVLFGQGELRDDVSVHLLPADNGVRRIEIVPHNPETGFQRIEAGFRDGLPIWMRVEDAFGRIVRFEFQNIVSNPPLPPDRFRFEIPPGADVIEAHAR